MKKIFRFCQKAFIRKDDKLLIVKTSEIDPSPNMWEVPGGAVEFGEDLEVSFEREVAEEVGLRVKKGKIFYICTSIYPFENVLTQAFSVFYRCQYLKGEVRLSKEHVDFRWIKPTEYDRFRLIEVFRPAFEEYLELKRK